MRAYLQQYVRLNGSRLFAKLQKRYWALSQIKERPIMFAVQDFHRLRSMTWSHSSLVELSLRYSSSVASPSRRRAGYYAGGHRAPPLGEQGDSVRILPLARTRDVSAVLANPHGTMTKFNRIGCLSGHGSRRVIMVRWFAQAPAIVTTPMRTSPSRSSSSR